MSIPATSSKDLSHLATVLDDTALKRAKNKFVSAPLVLDVCAQELMKEGASNCVERHLNLNDCDTSLLWTYSQVGHKCCFHSQRITSHAPRLRYTAYKAPARGDSKLRFTITAMEQEREGEIERLRKRQATTPHRTAKRSRLLEAKLRSKTVSRSPQ